MIVVSSETGRDKASQEFFRGVGRSFGFDISTRGTASPFAVAGGISGTGFIDIGNYQAGGVSETDPKNYNKIYFGRLLITYNILTNPAGGFLEIRLVCAPGPLTGGNNFPLVNAQIPAGTTYTDKNFFDPAAIQSPVMEVNVPFNFLRIIPTGCTVRVDIVFFGVRLDF